MRIPVYYDEEELQEENYIEYSNLESIRAEYPEMLKEEQWRRSKNLISQWDNRILKIFSNGTKIAVTMTKGHDSFKVTGIGSGYLWYPVGDRTIYTFS